MGDDERAAAYADRVTDGAGGPNHDPRLRGQLRELARLAFLSGVAAERERAAAAAEGCSESDTCGAIAARIREGG
jgi:hypothetical protein